MAKPSGAVIVGIAIAVILVILCLCSIISSIFASVNSGTTPPVPPKGPVEGPAAPTGPVAPTDPTKGPAPVAQPATQPATPTTVPSSCGGNASCIGYTTLASAGDVAGYDSASYNNTTLQACQDLCTKEKCTWLSWGDNNCILKNAPLGSAGTNIFNTVGTTCTYITPGTNVTGDQTHSRDKGSLSECNAFCNDNPNDCDFAWWDPSEKMCYTYDTKENNDHGYVSYFPVGAVCSPTWGK